MIDAMQFLDNTIFVIAGDGDISEQLIEKVEKQRLNDKVFFLGRMPLDELHKYTVQADLGMSLEENLGLNYYYALPNKLFDYIQLFGGKLRRQSATERVPIVRNER